MDPTLEDVEKAIRALTAAIVALTGRIAVVESVVREAQNRRSARLRRPGVELVSEALRCAGRPLTAREVADAAGMTHSHVRHTLTCSRHREKFRKIATDPSIVLWEMTA